MFLPSCAFPAAESTCFPASTAIPFHLNRRKLRRSYHRVQYEPYYSTIPTCVMPAASLHEPGSQQSLSPSAFVNKHQYTHQMRITQAAQSTGHSTQPCNFNAFASMRIKSVEKHTNQHSSLLRPHCSPLSCVSIFTSPEHMSLFVCVRNAWTVCCAVQRVLKHVEDEVVFLSASMTCVFSALSYITVLYYCTVEIWASRGTLAPFPALRGKRHVNHNR